MDRKVRPFRPLLEYGLLPVNVIVPKLDNATTLHTVAFTLLAKATVPEGFTEGVVPASEVAAILELPPSNLQLLLDTIAALYPDLLDLNIENVSASMVPVHCLCLFLLAQLYGKEQHRPEAMDHWPEAAVPSSPDGGSPTRAGSRSPTGHSSRALLRQQLQQHLRQQMQTARGFGDYLKRNVRRALVLCLTRPASTEQNSLKALVTKQEFNRISSLLEIAPGSKASPSAEADAADPASSVPLYSSRNSAPLEELATWLAQRWSDEFLSESPLHLYGTPTASKTGSVPGIVASPGARVDDRSIQAVHRGTVVKGEGDLPRGEAHIMDCHDSLIYLLCPLTHVNISACSDCTVVVGAVGGVLRIERCEKVQVIATSVRCYISSCHDCTACLGVNHPPYLIGDNRFISIGPFNTRYERLLQHMAQAGVRQDLPNRWNQPVVISSRDPRRASGSSSSSVPAMHLMPPADFLPFIIPFRGTSGPLAGGHACPQSTKWNPSCHKRSMGPLPPFPFSLPPEYDEAMQQKYSVVTDLRGRIKEATLDEGKRKELQAVIQGYFREWLNASNNIRQVYDLSKLEQEEGGQGQGAAGQAGHS